MGKRKRYVEILMQGIEVEIDGKQRFVPTQKIKGFAPAKWLKKVIKKIKTPNG